MSFEDFVKMKKPAEVEGEGLLDPASVLRIACDSKVMRVVLNADKEVRNIGRSSRTIPNAIRRVVIQRGKGGETGVGNLVLLCGFHHRVIHNGDWDVTMVNGRPVFTHELAEAG
ncbi:MAG TPA: hypothetical protein VL652_31180 [Kutzneria sp.]|nr:hypothetical protein [Kutzneria sp.]